MKKWMVYTKKADFKAISEKLHTDPVTVRILRNRDIPPEEMEKFLTGSIEETFSPLLLPDSIRFMNRLERAIRDGNSVLIVGDYDVDGVMASYIFLKGLRRIGLNASVRLPLRQKDGYGINKSIIDEAYRDKTDLIVTCDNGISAFSELEYADQLGIEVLLTDHHDIRKDEKGRDLLPKAKCVVNPKRQDSRYPYREIPGAVVAYKLIELLYEKKNIPKSEAYEFLEEAALAIVCDVCELKSENRIMLKEGLRRLKNTVNPGLSALMELGMINSEKLDVYHLGFVLGPMINAAGRLSDASLSLSLLMCDDREEALSIAERLKSLNDRRKEMTLKGVMEAERLIAEGNNKDRVIVAFIPGLHESIAGIVAGKIREKYYRPSLVITDSSEDGLSKGSGRSIEGYHMAEKLSEASMYLDKFGGHALAAGFSLKKENIDAFRKFLNERASIEDKYLEEKLWIDAVLPPDYFTEELLSEIEKLGPFGKGNTRPVFAWKDFKILEKRLLGKNKNAIRYKFSFDGMKGRNEISGIMFTENADWICREEKNEADIVYYPEINEYNGKNYLQIRIIDIMLR